MHGGKGIAGELLRVEYAVFGQTENAVREFQPCDFDGLTAYAWADLRPGRVKGLADDFELVGTKARPIN